VTIDAMGCQKEIAKQIVTQGGDYVLALKGNQGGLYDDVKLYMDSLMTQQLKNRPIQTTQTLDKGHGRIEERHYWITDAIDWLDQKKDWEGLKSVGVVESTRHIGENMTTEHRYYITIAIRLRALSLNWGLYFILTSWCSGLLLFIIHLCFIFYCF
jgi:predicted transposase YbfD/YdcC